MRRLIRRAVQQAQRIGLDRVHRLPGVVVEQMGDAYPVARARSRDRATVQAEEERFRETLERGLKVFEELAGKDAISAEEAFTLAATYGFPLELTVELAEGGGQAVDVDGYRREMERHREISRAGVETGVQRAAEFVRRRRRSKFVGGHEDRGADPARRLRSARGDQLPRQAARVAVLPRRRRSGHRHGLHRARRRFGHAGGLVEAYRFGDDQALLFRGRGFRRATA